MEFTDARHSWLTFCAQVGEANTPSRWGNYISFYFCWSSVPQDILNLGFGEAFLEDCAEQRQRHPWRVQSRSQSIFDLYYIFIATGEKAQWKMCAVLNIAPASLYLPDLGWSFGGTAQAVTSKKGFSSGQICPWLRAGQKEMGCSVSLNLRPLLMLPFLVPNLWGWQASLLSLMQPTVVPQLSSTLTVNLSSPPISLFLLLLGQRPLPSFSICYFLVFSKLGEGSIITAFQEEKSRVGTGLNNQYLWMNERRDMLSS